MMTVRLSESDLREIVRESVRKLLESEDSGYETFYRGYGSKYGSQRNHLLWLTDDLSYAKCYGDRVEEVVLDTNKLRIASINDVDEIIGYEFDYYIGLTKEDARLVIENGYNGYGFEANDDSSYCICLLDDEPIVERKDLEFK